MLFLPPNQHCQSTEETERSFGRGEQVYTRHMSSNQQHQTTELKQNTDKSRTLANNHRATRPAVWQSAETAELTDTCEVCQCESVQQSTVNTINGFATRHIHHFSFLSVDPLICSVI